MNYLRKIFRFMMIYGIPRTWFKVMGRLRLRLGVFRPIRFFDSANVGIIGCGQFSYATIGYFIASGYITPFVDCFDIDEFNLVSFADFYRIRTPSMNASQLIANKKVQYLYIASNHASHTPYAIEALKLGKSVYIEKPISVSFAQLAALNVAVERSSGAVYAGYNRPFASAVQTLSSLVRKNIRSNYSYSPVTLNCFITGHVLNTDHWYRLPTEGTRVCGNVGHWLDLAVHILEWDSLADYWTISLAFTNKSSYDDDFSISMTSNMGDLVVIVLTSRAEPFEGINETINFQKNNIICKIDDFRQMSLWCDGFRRHYRYTPKDVGHKKALHQPFDPKPAREWSQVVKSSLLMLRVAEMVKSGLEYSEFSFSDSAKLISH
jgi:predicted dehydrogenase